MPFDPDHHHRRSIRLKGYDYTQAGAYFITICVYGREPLFGHVAGEVVILSAYGQVVEQCWRSLARHTSRLILDAFVVMPDHLHGILMPQALIDGAASPDIIRATDRPCGTLPGSINALVQNFKSISTRRVNRMRCSPSAPLWQRDYYEHIIRDSADLDRIRRYIADNPTRWEIRRGEPQ
jgi:REP-associated tyrosine transposase